MPQQPQKRTKPETSLVQIEQLSHVDSEDTMQFVVATAAIGIIRALLRIADVIDRK